MTAFRRIWSSLRQMSGEMTGSIIGTISELPTRRDPVHKAAVH